MGVTERSGVGRFALAGDSSLGHLAGDGEQPVALTSCDEFVERYGLTPDLIKIDVEGRRSRGVAGRSTLTSRPAILLSTHGAAARAESLAYLRAAGYERIEPIDSPDADQRRSL